MERVGDASPAFGRVRGSSAVWWSPTRCSCQFPQLSIERAQSGGVPEHLCCLDSRYLSGQSLSLTRRFVELFGERAHVTVSTEELPLHRQLVSVALTLQVLQRSL